MSEKNRNKESKKWLISRMKTSGSVRERVESIDYADSRHLSSKINFETLPFHESMTNNQHFYNGKINTGLLYRFINTQIGKNWDEVYAEIIERIPSKLLIYKDIIIRYVADKVIYKDGKLWNLRENCFLIQSNEDLSHGHLFRFFDFYVDPDTNQLCRIRDLETRRVTKNMTKDELRTYRENNEQVNLEKKRAKKPSPEEIETTNQLLKIKKKPPSENM